MLICLVLGTLLTAGIMTSGNNALTGAFLGAILALYAGLVLAGYRFTVSQKAEPVLGPAAGVTTGLISGATGIFVVPVAPYLEALNLGKDGLVQAIGLTALIAILWPLRLALGLNGSLEVEVVVPGSIAVVAAFAGMFLGRALRARLSVELFRRWVLIGLFSLGAAMIIRAF